MTARDGGEIAPRGPTIRSELPVLLSRLLELGAIVEFSRKHSQLTVLAYDSKGASYVVPNIFDEGLHGANALYMSESLDRVLELLIDALNETKEEK